MSLLTNKKKRDSLEIMKKYFSTLEVSSEKLTAKQKEELVRAKKDIKQGKWIVFEDYLKEREIL